jgi:hypothetical protein
LYSTCRARDEQGNKQGNLPVFLSIDGERFLLWSTQAKTMNVEMIFISMLQGLWGQSLFDKFDKSHHDFIDFHDFLIGIGESILLASLLIFKLSEFLQVR